MGKDGVAEDDEQDLARGFSDEVDAEKRKFLARARFAEFKDRQVQKRKLKGSAAFEKVWTPAAAAIPRPRARPTSTSTRRARPTAAADPGRPTAATSTRW